MNKAKKMLFASFLACVALGTGSALMACGGTTSSGGTSTPDSSTPEVWELENAAVVYTFDKDGVETANYTVKGKNGEEYTKSVATGRKVVELDVYSVKVNGELIEEPVLETTVGNEPKVEVLALFDDGSASWVTITDDMYVGEKPDYTKAGLYTANIKLVERLSAPVLVTDGEPVELQSMLLNEDMNGMCLLWDKADVVAGTYDVSTVFWMHMTYLNGEMSQAVSNATAEQIKPIDWTAESEEGIYNFSVTNAAGDSGILQAYVLDDDSETAVVVGGRQLGSMTMTEEPKVLKGTEVSAIDTSKMLVMEMLMIGTDTMGMRMVEVPEDAVYTLDTTTVGQQALTAKWTVGEGDDAEEVTATASMLVYENKEEYAEVSEVYVNSYEAVESGVADIEFEIYSETRYTAGTGDDKQILMTTGGNAKSVALTADMIKGTAPDFTTAGVKVFTIEVGGEEYTYAVELTKTEKAVATTTNIASIALPEEITLLKDENVELYVRKNLVGEQVEITYIEPVNGEYESEVILKADAFDWSDVKTDTVGEYAIKVAYEDYTQEITVNVVAELAEEEEAQVVAMLQNDGSLELTGLNMRLLGVQLYSDDTVEIMDGYSIYYYEAIWGTYTIDEATGTLEISVDGAKFAIAKVTDTDTDGVYDTVSAYEFGDATAEYSFVDSWENQVTISLYEEGYAQGVNQDGFVMFSGGYTLKDGLLTIGDKKFYIQGTGADAKVIEVMQNQNF